ncbi:hypothetical protein ACKS0A_05761 [Histoplasma ohiense]
MLIVASIFLPIFKGFVGLGFYIVTMSNLSGSDLIESFSEPMQTHKDYCNVYECMVGDNGNDINEQLLIGFQILDVVGIKTRFCTGRGSEEICVDCFQIPIRI